MTECQCAYPLGDGPPPLEFCGAPVRPGSAYCPAHHRVCYLPLGSRRERDAFQRLDRLATFAGRRSDNEAADQFIGAFEPAAHAPAAPAGTAAVT